MGELTIRDARPDEHDAVVRLTQAAYAEYEASMGDHWPDYWNGVAGRLAARVADYIVAERDGALVGSVLLYPAGSTAIAPDGRTLHFHEPEVGLLSVPPPLRGQGIARVLMAECARRAGASGAKVLALHTMDMMTAAMGLYERIGFARDPEHDFTPAPHFTVRAYRLALPQA